ncbi:keratinocyte-associated protein 3 [Pyxicephalus adspersus]
MAAGRSVPCGFSLEKGPRKLMRAGLALIFVGHVNFILGAIVHGTILRHVANPEKRVSPEYCTANIISVVSGLLVSMDGVVRLPQYLNTFLVSMQHWTLLVLSLLNALLSAACFVGLILSISLTIANGGKNLISGCNATVLPSDTRSVIMSNECPFDTTRIYDTTLALWFPSMFLSAVEAALSIRCCVVAFILRGIGPCGETYIREKLQEEEAEKERLEDVSRPETHQLMEAQA